MRIRRKIYSGVVLEMTVFNTKSTDAKKAVPRLRFKNEEERRAHRLGISRRRHARLVNENFSPASLYSTLTFDNESEVHSFREAKRLRDNFVRRLQRACPEGKIIIYMGRGKHTRRIHFHMLTDGVPESVILDKWQDGEIIRIDHLRAHNVYDGVDCGADYTGLANYLFDHWTEEQGGHRYKATRNLKHPEAEQEEVKRVYTADKPPRAPKGYMLTEVKTTGFGLLYYKYVVIPPKRR